MLVWPPLNLYVIFQTFPLASLRSNVSHQSSSKLLLFLCLPSSHVLSPHATSFPYLSTTSASLSLPGGLQMLSLSPHSHLPQILLLPARRLRPLAALRPHTASDAVAENDLRSTWPHRAWVAAGFTTVLSSLTHAATSAADSGDALHPLLAVLLGYLLTDLGTGVYHWAIDNYGTTADPFFGPQIAAFQGHHRRPSTITRRGFSNNLHALARSVALVTAPLDAAAGGDATAHAFVAACAGCIMLSQQFHAWAHEGRARLPALVAVLQDAGVLVSARQHGRHHRPPYNSNYCIVSGVWNGVLDECRVFEVAEMIIFFRFGVRPRSWGETALEWAEEPVAVAAPETSN